VAKGKFRSLVAVSLLSSCAVEPVFAEELTEEACDTISVIMEIVAEARDKQLPPEFAMQYLASLRTPVQLAYEVTAFVYIVHADKSPQEIKDLGFNNCMRELGEKI